MRVEHLAKARPQAIWDSGLPAPLLTSFLRNLSQNYALGTVRRYARALTCFFSWLERSEGPIEIASRSEARAHIYDFLISAASCQVRPRKYGRADAHFSVEPTRDTNLDVCGVLIVLKHYYQWLQICHLYTDPISPLVVDEPRRPIVSDEDDRAASFWLFGQEPLDNFPRRMWAPENFFRFRAEEWEPNVMEDTDAPLKVLESGIELGWPASAEAIARILIEAAPRISEACGLTMGDWWSGSHFLNSAKSKDKGSHGRRRKMLIWGTLTTRVLHQYVDIERSQIQPENLYLSDYMERFQFNSNDPLSHEPIFLTRAGNAMSPDYFRRKYWAPAASKAGLHISPHKVRHRFVSLALDRIESELPARGSQTVLKQSLVKYMAWRSKSRPLIYYDARPAAKIFGSLKALLHLENKESISPHADVKETDSDQDRKRGEAFRWLTEDH